jgi:hypothetical protein
VECAQCGVVWNDETEFVWAKEHRVTMGVVRARLPDGAPLQFTVCPEKAAARHRGGSAMVSEGSSCCFWEGWMACVPIGLSVRS